MFFNQQSFELRYVQRRQQRDDGNTMTPMKKISLSLSPFHRELRYQTVVKKDYIFRQVRGKITYSRRHLSSFSTEGRKCGRVEKMMLNLFPTESAGEEIENYFLNIRRRLST